MQCQSACSGYRKTIPRMRIRGEKLFCSLAFVILFHIFPINRLLKVESPKISKEKSDHIESTRHCLLKYFFSLVDLQSLPLYAA